MPLSLKNFKVKEAGYAQEQTHSLFPS